MQNVPRPLEPGFWRPVLIFALLFVLLRAALFPSSICTRGSAVAEAAAYLELKPDRSLLAPAGWLQLPWVSLLAGLDAAMPLELFAHANDRPAGETVLRARDFRHYFIAAFVREIVFWTWWLGPALAALLLFRQAEPAGRTAVFGAIVPFALAAGSVAGVLATATLACVFLAVETAPHIVWEVVFGRTSSVGFLPLWLIVATGAWLIAGACVGIVVAVAPTLRRAIVPGPQALLGWLCRLCRMRRLEKLIDSNANH